MPMPAAPKLSRTTQPTKKLTKAERKRYVETAKNEAKRHRRTLAALAK